MFIRNNNQKQLDNAVNKNKTTAKRTPPSKLVCPLTLQLMKDPVMSIHGHNFERKAIFEWLHCDNDTCPITRKPLTVGKLIRNGNLALTIHQWRVQNSDNAVMDDEATASNSGSSSGSVSCDDSEDDNDPIASSPYALVDKYEINERTRCMDGLGNLWIPAPTSDAAYRSPSVSTALASKYVSSSSDTTKSPGAKHQKRGALAGSLKRWLGCATKSSGGRS